jgi:hypothetical protein
MPTRYIVVSDGMVEHADISVDYTRRSDPSELFPFSTTLRPGRTPCEIQTRPPPRSEAPESVPARPKTDVIRFQAAFAGGNLEGTR